MKRKIKLIFILSFYFLLNRIFIVFTRLKSTRVLFVSDVREELGGNLKCMYDYLDNKDYERIVILKKERRSRRSFKDTLRLAYYLSTSRYILLDDYLQCLAFIKVRKNQEIVQLWHGPGAFKKFGYSRPGNEKYRKNLVKGHKHYTKAIVTSDDIRWCFAEGFGMDIKNVYDTGFPRMDIFFDKKYINKTKKEIYDEYPILKNKKVILFAPTYRGDNVRIASYDFDKLDLDKLYKELKDDYVFVFKWHPAIYNNMTLKNIKSFDEDKYKDFFIDLSNLRDINDLLLVTDVLITDYSSVIFDYLLVNKPIVYFTYDLDLYDKDRGTYFDFDDYVYGEISKNTKELIKSIKNENMMEDKRKKFTKQFMDSCDGNSTKKVIDVVFNSEGDK